MIREQRHVACAASRIILPWGDDDGWSLSHSGLALPGHLARRPTGIDLFAGCGGFSLGFITAGFEVLAGVDNDPYSALTYMHNLGSYPCRFHWVETDDEHRMERALRKSWKRQKGRAVCRAYTSGGGWISAHPEAAPVRHFFLGDVRQLSGKDILAPLGIQVGEIDCVFGGPPCQGFSRGNTRRSVMDPRNSLVFEFARLVCEIRPRTLVMENVPGIIDMVTPEGMPVLDAFSQILEAGGMGTYEGLRHALASRTGAAAAFRGSKPKRQSRLSKRKREPEGPHEEEEEMPLFAEEVRA